MPIRNRKVIEIKQELLPTIHRHARAERLIIQEILDLRLRVCGLVQGACLLEDEEDGDAGEVEDFLRHAETLVVVGV